MDRINGADTTDIGGGRRGFRDENLVTGTAGTVVTALHLNSMQEELLKVITEAGLVPSDADWTQLWQALQALGLSPDRSRRWLSVNSMTLSSAPGAPSSGDAYLVPVGATGIWAGNVGKIAMWSGASWTYITPTDGHGISLPDGRVFERIGGTYVEKLALDAQSGKWAYAVAGGTASAITASLTPAPAALSDGMVVFLRLASALPGAATLNLNGLGAKPIRTPYLNNPATNDALAGSVVSLIYNASSGFFIIQPSAAPYHVTTIYSAPGTSTWTAPVTGWYWVEVYGGGGASASYTGNIQGEGGGGGGYAGEWLFFTAGQTVSMTIGAAGVFGGANGGTTSFGSFLSATGGGTASTGGVPGSGGMGAGGMVNLKGQDGTDGNNNGQWAGFGGDAAGPNGGKGAVTSNGATWPGGGGGLLSYSSNIIWYGDAASGGVIITY